MVHKTRVAAATALTLMALTGCGQAATEAAPSYIYSPLPAFSTATPEPTKKPVPSASPSPSPSPSPTATPSEESVAEGAAAAPPAEAPAQASVPGGAVAQQPVPGGAAQQPVPGGSVARQPAPMPGPPAGSAPVQVMQRSTSTTTAVTSTRVEGRVRIVVTCEGRCMLDDLDAPGLTGEEGPISEELLQQALEELRSQGVDTELVVGDLAEKLAKGEWELADKLLEDGNEKLVFLATGR